MIFESRTRVRLTARELNTVRQSAARNGVVVNRIETPNDLLRATLDALPAQRQAELLKFLETGAVPERQSPCNSQASHSEAPGTTSK